MMKFSYQFDEEHPKISMKLDPASDLPTVFTEFKHFLLACGYVFNGDVVIANTDKESQND